MTYGHDRAQVGRALALSPTPFRSLPVPPAQLVKAFRPYRHSRPDVMTLAGEIENWHRGATVDT